ncbi:MAG TPA: AAA family ATPase [Candidatus Dormibacteraeota bacterium]|nr:AAA family ATPase [Candidatus Dormibacteraeota bacterium]
MSADPAAVPEALPYIGRARELAAVTALLDEALQGRGRLLLVSGEAGIGKSRLLRELQLRSEERGAPVAWGRSLEAGGAPPYWPWIKMLQQLGTTLPAGEERFAVFDAVARILRERAAGAGLVLLLDDIHWADPSSLRLLEQVAQGWESTRGLLVASHRSTPLKRGDPLRRCLAALSRLDTTVRIDLTGLNVEETAAHLATVGGRTLSGDVVVTLHRRTGGNPFFLSEFGRLLRADRKQPRLDTARDVPGSVSDVIAERVSLLSPGCQEVLDVAAVVGAQPSLPVVAAVLAQPVTTVLERFDEAAAAGLLGAAGGAPHVFSHALVRDALYSDLGTARRLELHERIATQLERRGDIADVATISELAHHWLAAAPAGHEHHAAEVAERAAGMAQARLAYEDAARLYEAAARVLPTDPDERALRGRLLVSAAREHFRAGDLQHAVDACQQCAAIARDLGDSHLLADAALAMSGVGDAAISAMIAGLCREALDSLAHDDVLLRSRLLAELTVAKHYLGAFDELDALSREALDEAERAGDHDALIAALRARQIAKGHPAGVTERMALADRLLEAARHGGGPLDEMWAHLWHFDAHMQLGRLDLCTIDVAEVSKAVEHIKQPLAAWHVSNYRVAIAHARGDFTAALQACEEGERHARSAGELALQRATMQRAFIALMTGGDCSSDAAALEQFGTARPGQRMTSWMLMPRFILAMLALARDELEEAAAVYDSLPPTATWELMPPVFLVATAHRTVVLTGLGRREECPRLYSDLLPFADHFITSGAGTIVCFGSVELYLGMLAACMARGDAAVTHMERAVERNEAAGMRPWAAISRHRLAQALRQRDRSGDVARALMLAGQALTAARSMGMAPLERRSTLLQEQLRAGTRQGRLLTPREEEIARMVAEGLTSKEIAAAMHISPRTADNHVQHILEKLEMRSRSQVAAWVARQAAGERH